MRDGTGRGVFDPSARKKTKSYQECAAAVSWTKRTKAPIQVRSVIFYKLYIMLPKPMSRQSARATRFRHYALPSRLPASIFSSFNACLAHQLPSDDAPTGEASFARVHLAQPMRHGLHPKVPMIDHEKVHTF